MSSLPRSHPRSEKATYPRRSSAARRARTSNRGSPESAERSSGVQGAPATAKNIRSRRSSRSSAASRTSSGSSFSSRWSRASMFGLVQAPACSASSPRWSAPRTRIDDEEGRPAGDPVQRTRHPGGAVRGRKGPRRGEEQLGLGEGQGWEREHVGVAAQVAHNPGARWSAGAPDSLPSGFRATATPGATRDRPSAGHPPAGRGAAHSATATSSSPSAWDRWRARSGAVGAAATPAYRDESAGWRARSTRRESGGTRRSPGQDSQLAGEIGGDGVLDVALAGGDVQEDHAGLSGPDSPSDFLEQSGFPVPRRRAQVEVPGPAPFGIAPTPP